MITGLIVFILSTLSSYACSMEINPYEKYYGKDQGIFDKWDTMLEAAIAKNDTNMLSPLRSSIVKSIKIVCLNRLLKESLHPLSLGAEMTCLSREYKRKHSVLFNLIAILEASKTAKLDYQKTGYPAVQEEELLCFIRKAVTPEMLALEECPDLPEALLRTARYGLIKSMQIILSSIPGNQQQEAVNNVIADLQHNAIAFKGKFKEKQDLCMQWLQQWLEKSNRTK